MTAPLDGDPGYAERRAMLRKIFDEYEARRDKPVVDRVVGVECNACGLQVFVGEDGEVPAIFGPGTSCMGDDCHGTMGTPDRPIPYRLTPKGQAGFGQLCGGARVTSEGEAP